MEASLPDGPMGEMTSLMSRCFVEMRDNHFRCRVSFWNKERVSPIIRHLCSIQPASHSNYSTAENWGKVFQRVIPQSTTEEASLVFSSFVD